LGEGEGLRFLSFIRFLLGAGVGDESLSFFPFISGLGAGEESGRALFFGFSFAYGSSGRFGLRWSHLHEKMKLPC
jgi:hypothetical protein